MCLWPLQPEAGWELWAYCHYLPACTDRPSSSQVAARGWRGAAAVPFPTQRPGRYRTNRRPAGAICLHTDVAPGAALNGTCTRMLHDLDVSDQEVGMPIYREGCTLHEQTSFDLRCAFQSQAISAAAPQPVGSGCCRQPVGGSGSCGGIPDAARCAEARVPAGVC